MKHILLSILLLCAFSGMTQLERVVLEPYLGTEVDPPSGFQVYRLYAELENDNDYVRAFSSTNGCASMEIKTTEEFYNAPVGASVASSSLFNLVNLFPEIVIDTYLTIGIDENYNGNGSLQQAFNNSDSLALYESFTINPGTNLIIQDGGITNINPAVSDNGFAIGPENRVLLAQLTTNGKIYYKVNLEVLVNGDPENVIKYFWQVTDDCGSGNIQTGAEYGLIEEYNYCDNPLAENYDSSPPEDGIALESECILIEGCIDPFACNYAQENVVDDGSCIYPDGCTDSLACNYNESALCDDGSCTFEGCFGCTDEGACNFNPSALFDDGSCDLPNGCTDELACNYQFWANCDNGSCEYLSCLGCTDPTACNFDAEAIFGDGSCEFDSCLGCTDSSACNFDPSALINDGSCILPDGCADELACNYDPFAMCEDNSCEFLTCAGCTDPLAINYDSGATIEDGSCDYSCDGEIISVSWYSGSFTDEISWELFELEGEFEAVYSSPEDLSEDLIIEWCLLPGCYRLVMSDDFGDGWNGSSLVYEANGDEIAHTLEFGTSSFDIVSIATPCERDGCTNSLALNFDPSATLDDGSCVYESVPRLVSETFLQIRFTLFGWDGSDDAVLSFSNLGLNQNAEVIIQDIRGRVIWDNKWRPAETKEETPLTMLKGDGWYLITLKQGNQKVSKAYLKRSSG